MNTKPNPAVRWLTLGLMSPHVFALAVWAFTAHTGPFPAARDPAFTFLVDMSVAGCAVSLAGLLAAAIGACIGEEVDRPWWLTCVGVNAAGIVASCAGLGFCIKLAD